MRITVLGAGNGGQALAGHLASMEHEVVLYEIRRFFKNIENISKNKKIRLTGFIEGVGHLSGVTCDPEEAVKGSDILYLAAPSFAQAPILNEVGPFLEDGQTLVLLPGNFGSLTFRIWLRENDIDKKIDIAETDTLPYACRITEPGEIDVWGMKEYLSIAGLPDSRTDRIIEKIAPCFPVSLNKAPNVVAIGLYNTNMILHCPTMLMNAGRIEATNGKFSFYKDGMTESVCAVMEEMDKERMAVGRALGIDLLSTMDDMKNIYGLQGDSLREVILNNPAYCGHGMDAPTRLNHRYLEEDVPYLLVPVSRLADKLDIPTPAIDSVIYLAGIVNGKNYYQEGPGLRELGFEDMSSENIMEFVKN